MCLSMQSHCLCVTKFADDFFQPVLKFLEGAFLRDFRNKVAGFSQVKCQLLNEISGNSITLICREQWSFKRKMFFTHPVITVSCSGFP